ncbi:hypothetical protein QR680_016411 [Steinernema hermaphroditum]|uniref:Serpentine receptor class gamma n=1 Tax=Steinernema hermaphroditum TaxID=289476 RepID=A0AA39HB51_9BILA|nr:hypothetical protein QR680_016411 [Steinernema hermaphroditum]
MHLFLVLALALIACQDGVGLPLDIDLANIKEGTVVNADGSKVTTTLKKEGSTTLITILTIKKDGTQHLRTIKHSLMGGTGNWNFGFDVPKPGSTTKPDGTEITTTEEKKDGNTVTTMIEKAKNGTVTTKVITTRPNGSQHLELRVKLVSEKLDPAKIDLDALRSSGSNTGGNGAVKTTTKDENGMTVTVMEKIEPGGSVQSHVPKKLCGDTRIMEMYMFRHAEYQHYYNCSMKTSEEWSQIGVRNVGMGIFSIALGFVSLPLYIPCLKTMLKPELWQYSCYKLMFYNGIVDVIGIINSCFFTGYFAIQGTVFCHSPDFNYLYGCVIMGFWTIQCMTSVLLAFNRCVDFWQNSFLSSLFRGRRTYFWFLLPTTYFLYFCFFVPPCIYSSYVNMWVLDPFLGIDVETDKSLYTMVWPLNANNTLLVAILSFFYVALVFSIWWKSRLCPGELMTKLQRQVTLQAFLICMIIDLNGVIYVLFEFFPNLPGVFMTFVFLLWQWGCCGVVFIYLILNRTLREGVLQFYCCRVPARITHASALISTTATRRSQIFTI